jgi:hypothetical protein
MQEETNEIHALPSLKQQMLNVKFFLFSEKIVSKQKNCIIYITHLFAYPHLNFTEKI